MAAKKSKLLEQFHSNAKSEQVKSAIFKGIGILVNGYTKPSAEELKQIMLEHGGIYSLYEIPGLITHIIASNLPNVKVIIIICTFCSFIIVKHFRSKIWVVFQLLNQIGLSIVFKP